MSKFELHNFFEKKILNFTLSMMIGVLLLILVSTVALSFGAANVPLLTTWNALFHFNPAITEHQIIQTLRLPRTLADGIVGASLAVCGALMQGTTRNPLADSGLMGISSGATFAIAICIAFVPAHTYEQMILFACMGAAIATGITYSIASLGRHGMTPQRLVLAGISISMLFSALSSYIAIKYRIWLSLAYWTAGGTASIRWSELMMVAPFFLGGLLMAISLSPAITVLNLGEEIATGLGIRLRLIKGLSTVVVLVLTGLSVSIVGPVGFIGLIVPHLVRHLVGADYRYIIPASALYGALLTITADLIGRLINKPFETPLGIIFAIIGVPCFLYLARKQQREFK